MFEITFAQDVSILHLYGEISKMEMEIISRLITSCKKRSFNKIVLDLAQVDHVHFQAVCRWTEAACALRDIKGDLKIAGPSLQTKQMMTFTGADQFLKDYNSVGEAVLSFLGGFGSPDDSSYWLSDSRDEFDHQTQDAGGKRPKTDRSLIVH